MLEKLKSNLETWRLLTLSMIGRVNAMKMMALPRFLYLFQSLPVYIPQAFFKTLNSIILPFIWGFKTHRISRKHTTKPKTSGGLGLPIFQHYYWAANCRALMYWHDAYTVNVSDSTPSWLAIEQDLPKALFQLFCFHQLNLQKLSFNLVL